MVATFREEELEEAKKIMNAHHSRLAYSKIYVADGTPIYLTESGDRKSVV